PDSNWACLILAYPFSENNTLKLRNFLINESRVTESQTDQGKSPNPLAKHYLEFLQYQIKILMDGQTNGTWRTAVYLMGDKLNYHRLASSWKSIFTGTSSEFE